MRTTAASSSGAPRKSSFFARQLAKFGVDLAWNRWGDGQRDGLALRWRDHDNEVARGSIVRVAGPARAVELFVVNHTDAIQGQHSQGQFYEPEELAIIQSHLKGGVFVDIGANVGNHLVYVLTQLGIERAIAFEPNPAAARILRINLALNGLSQATDVHEIGLGDANAAGFMSIASEHNIGGARMIVSDDNSGIAIRRGDDVLADVEVGFIKIDVEGFEIAVLRGLRETIARCRPPIFVEVDTGSLADFDTICSEIGYIAVDSFQRYQGVVNKMIVPSSGRPIDR